MCDLPIAKLLLAQREAGSMRQVIQLTGPVNSLVALCDEGSVW